MGVHGRRARGCGGLLQRLKASHTLAVPGVAVRFEEPDVTSGAVDRLEVNMETPFRVLWHAACLSATGTLRVHRLLVTLRVLIACGTARAFGSDELGGRRKRFGLRKRPDGRSSGSSDVMICVGGVW